MEFDTEGRTRPSRSSMQGCDVAYLIFDICHLAFVICHLLFVLFLVSCARPDDAWDRVREVGVLRVGMDASFPPFETIAADGTLVGFDVDLARELGRRLGVEIQFVANLPYDGLYDALAVGRVDVVISALVVNPARMADFAYSASYFDAGQVLVVRDGESRTGEACPEPVDGTDRGHLARLEDGCTMDRGHLARLEDGCTLAVEFGTRGDLEARKWARRLSALKVVPYQTAAEALAAIRAGEADAALVDHVSALELVVEEGFREGTTLVDHAAECMVIVGQPVVEEPYAVAVRRDSRYLLRAIDDVLADMKADGTMERLTAEWLAGEPSIP